MRRNNCSNKNLINLIVKRSRYICAISEKIHYRNVSIVATIKLDTQHYGVGWLSFLVFLFNWLTRSKEIDKEVQVLRRNKRRDRTTFIKVG